MDYFNAPTRIEMSQAKNFRQETASLTEQMNKLGAGCSTTLNPAIAMADQPGMIATGGFGMAGGGCTVDLNTEMKWGIEGSHREKGPKQLWVRPYATTPNLGGGDASAVDDESSLLHSTLVRNRKETSTIMDKAIPNFFQPLLAVKQSEYSNTNNWIESWTRGGDNARSIHTKRDTE